MGRGISVTWNAREKNRVVLRLLSPTGSEELREFYAMAGRVLKYWNAELEADGEKTNLNSWLAGMDAMLDFNIRTLDVVCERLQSGEDKEMTLFSARWPLTLGAEEADRFHGDQAAFDRWLHEKQSVEAYYAVPHFYKLNGELVGIYVLSADCRSIFASVPSVPFGHMNPETGKALQCDSFRVSFYSSTEQKMLGDLSFDEFLSRLPAEKYTRYDEKNNLIEPMKLDELRALLE